MLQLVVLTGEKPEEWRPRRPHQMELAGGAQITVRAVANCDEVELFLNNRSLGRHAVSHDVYSTDWTVPYEPGVLSAVGYRAGKKVATQELRTTGVPTRLQITPLASPIASDLAL